MKVLPKPKAWCEHRSYLRCPLVKRKPAGAFKPVAHYRQSYEGNKFTLLKRRLGPQGIPIDGPRPGDTPISSAHVSLVRPAVISIHAKACAQIQDRNPIPVLPAPMTFKGNRHR